MKGELSPSRVLNAAGYERAVHERAVHEQAVHEQAVYERAILEQAVHKQTTHERVVHEFAPVYDGASRILILGTFPSVRSREQHFYYGHPQNRFWKVLAALLKTETPGTIPEKTRFLLENRIAVWDVIASCEIVGSSDSSIRKVQANDIAGLLQNSRISAVYANGSAAARLYRKYCLPSAGTEAVCLPSTSPANAAWSLPRLTEAWRVILPELSEQDAPERPRSDSSEFLTVHP